MSKVRLGDRWVTPSKIVCIGRNYLEHIHELHNTVTEEMVVFNKPNSAISQQLYAYHQEPLHYESEICFLIKKGRYYAVGVGLDLTKRALQTQLKQKGLPWERAKAFDGSALLSRFIPLKGIDIEQLQLELFINCVRVQVGKVTQMIYSPTTILEKLSDYTTLNDNDIVMTGTPKGVGEIHRGDLFLARILYDDKILIEAEWLAQ